MKNSDSMVRKASTLSKARYLGSAKSGTHHWWMQRVTSVALIFLGLWFLYAIATVPDIASFEGVTLWLQAPFNAVMMVLFLAVGLYHGSLGLQVVIEDYVHTQFTKFFLLYGMKFLAVVLFAFAAFSIVKAQLLPGVALDQTNILVNVEQNS